MSTSQEQVKTNDVSEEIKASLTNLIDLGRTLQSLSGRLSLIAEECRKIDGVSRQVQSNVSLLQRSLSVMQQPKVIYVSDSNRWIYHQSLEFKSLFTAPKKRKWPLVTNLATFKKFLSELHDDANGYGSTILSLYKTTSNLDP
jgi:hypothetical protein